MRVQQEVSLNNNWKGGREGGGAQHSRSSSIFITKATRKTIYSDSKYNGDTYLRVASALSIVTLSLVASRLGRPRSKYLISKSKNGNISCRVHQSTVFR